MISAVPIRTSTAPRTPSSTTTQQGTPPHGGGGGEREAVGGGAVRVSVGVVPSTRYKTTDNMIRGVQHTNVHTYTHTCELGEDTYCSTYI